MRRYSRSFVTLALVSSVAVLSLTAYNAQAQNYRRAPRSNTPSVEIHLEVLNSLRQEMTDRQFRREVAPNYRQEVIRQDEGIIDVPSRPYDAGESFASRVAQELPSASRRRAPLHSEVIMQPLPKKRSHASVAVPANDEVIMQPLPQRQAVAERNFPIVESDAQHPLLAQDETSEVYAELQTQPQEAQPASLLDKITNIFSDDEESEQADILKQPGPQIAEGQIEAIETVEPIPVIVDEVADIATETAQATVSAIVSAPEPVNPSAKIVSEILAPEIRTMPNSPERLVVEEKETIEKEDGFQLVPSAVEQKPVVKPVLAEPVEVEKPLLIEATPPALVIEEKEEFPSLSEVQNSQETSSSMSQLLNDLPQSSQEWLGAETGQEQEFIEQAPLVSQEKPVVAPILEPEEIVIEPQPKVTPKQLPKKVEKSIPEPLPLREPAEKTVLEPIIQQEPALTQAESSFFDNAQKVETRDVLQTPDSSTEERSFMELALEELEPAEETVPNEPPLKEEDFTFPEPTKAPVVIATKPVQQAPEKEEGFFPGITKAFKEVLTEPSVEEPVAAAQPVARPKPVIMDKQETVQRVLPPELPVVAKAPEPALPSMQLLDEDVGNRFIDEFGLSDIDLKEEDFAPVEVPLAPPEVVDVAEPVIENNKPVESDSFEVASLPAEGKTVKVQSGPSVSDLQVVYGPDDTDIPDGKKTKLGQLVSTAKEKNKRIIIATYAGGEEHESKAANMISLSRGLSLRAFFIDQGMPMDQIIVQAKGLESAEGPPDRADISLD